VLLAELEVWHSRSIAPTRRVALGRRLLPVDPAPGFGGLLLGGVVASSAPELDDELAAELWDLLGDLEAGRRIPQPSLRHRFQVDRHGLARTSHRLLGEGERIELESKGHGSPASQALAAAYAAGQLPPDARRPVIGLLRRGLSWRGELGPSLFAHLARAGGGSSPGRPWAAYGYADPSLWALDVLGLAGGAAAGTGPPERRQVQRAFRILLREAHPDHGATPEGAAARIAELREARRILLTTGER
jgi:hypothetical protein